MGFRAEEGSGIVGTIFISCCLTSRNEVGGAKRGHSLRHWRWVTGPLEGGKQVMVKVEATERQSTLHRVTCPVFVDDSHTVGMR